MLRYFQRAAAANAPTPAIPPGLLQLPPELLGATCWTNIPNAEFLSDELRQLAIFYARIALDGVLDEPLCPRLAGSSFLITERLSLRTRSVNVCAEARFETLGELAKVTFGRLRALPTCGITTILDLVCSLESVNEIPLELEFGDMAVLASPPPPTAIQNLLEKVARSAFAPSQGRRLLAAAAALHAWEEKDREQLNAILLEMTPNALVRTATNGESPSVLCGELLDAFKERPRAIFAGRFLARKNGPTLEDLGRRFQITRERIRQLETKIDRQLARIVASEAQQPLVRCAAAFRILLGGAIPISNVQQRIELLCPGAWDLVRDCEISAADILLWLAGPYREKDGWLVASAELEGASKKQLLAQAETSAFVSANAAVKTLERLGIREVFALQWIEWLGCLRAVPGGWIKADGSLVVQCIAWIRYKGVPVNIEELARVTGTESERSLRARLLEDSRVKRVNKQGDFALAEWQQFDKYTGIAEEIAQEIASCGGAASVDHLISTIAPRYGVKPSSVRQYAAAPMFIQGSDRLVRLRGEEHKLIVEADPAENAGCYFVDDAWIFRFEVNSETLRGSGRAIPNGFAVALGCQPGSKLSIPTVYGEVTVSWPNTTAAGPNIGSLRHIAEKCALVAGDWIFFGRVAGEGIVRTLSAKSVAEETSDALRVLRLMGFQITTPHFERPTLWGEIATALGSADASEDVTSSDVRRILHARGETLLERFVQETAAPSTEDALNRIVDLLG